MTDDIVFRSPRAPASVEMHKSVRSSMQMHVNNLNRETGGILTGYYIRGTVAKVLTAHGPPPDSRATRTSFERGVIGLTEILRDLWPGVYYLGEWHYHPGPPVPSDLDLATLRDIAHDEDLECPQPIQMIIGPPGSKPSMTCHLYLDYL